MLIDILIFVPTLICILLGLRDGIVRKIVAIVVLIAGLILAQIYMRDVSDLLSSYVGFNHEDVPVKGFLVIILGLLIIQGILYRILAKNYKIGGIADRIGGMTLGFVEGVILVSSLLFVFAMTGFPDYTTSRDSQFYKSVVNIAPQILDFTSSVGPDSIEKLKDIGTSGAIEVGKKVKGIHESVDTSAALNKRKQFEKIDQAREIARKQNP